MPRLRSIGVAAMLAAAVFALPLAACGDDTDEKNEYVDAVNEATTALNAGLSEIASQGGAFASPDEASNVLSDFSTQLATASADISAITPPDDVADLHNQLVEELNDLSSESINAANEISAGGQAAVAGVTAEFVTVANRLSAEADATISEINETLRE